MPQPSTNTRERRDGPRRTTAFAFWVHNGEHGDPRGAWMLNIGPHGGAFLLASDQRPAVGQRLELSEMHTSSRVVREGACSLPCHAEVVRVESGESLTCQIAVRFADQSPIAGGTAPRDRDNVAVTPRSLPAAALSVPPFGLPADTPRAQTANATTTLRP